MKSFVFALTTAYNISFIYSPIANGAKQAGRQGAQVPEEGQGVRRPAACRDRRRRNQVSALLLMFSFIVSPQTVWILP